MVELRVQDSLAEIPNPVAPIPISAKNVVDEEESKLPVSLKVQPMSVAATSPENVVVDVNDRWILKVEYVPRKYRFPEMSCVTEPMNAVVTP